MNAVVPNPDDNQEHEFYENRRHNLQLLAEIIGNKSQLSQQIGHERTYASQVLSGRRNVSSVSARQIEATFDFELGFLDKRLTRAALIEAIEDASGSVAKYADVLEGCVSDVLKEERAKSLKPEQIAQATRKLFEIRLKTGSVMSNDALYAIIEVL